MSIGRVPGTTGIQPSIVDAKGDLIVATAADSVDRLAVGSANQVLTVDSSTATGLKWAATQTPAFVGCSLVDGTNGQSIANATYTRITWSLEDFDTDAFHSTSTNTSRITIPSGKAGKYQVNAFVQNSNSVTGERRIAIYKNGTVVKTGIMAGAPFCQPNIALILDLAVGDYLEVFAYQNSGGTITMFMNIDAGHFSVAYLGA